MSDTFDFDDEAEGGRRKASLRQVAAFMWKHWSSQPGKLALVGLFFGAAVVADLAMPFASKHLVDALTAGPSEAGQRAAAWGYGVVVLLAFVFYMTRNIGVRFHIPFASKNMERIVTDGFRDVQRFSADWHADNFAGATVRRVSRAMNAYDVISDTMVWYMIPAAAVLIGVTVLTFMQWPVIGGFTGVTILAFLAVAYLASRFYVAEPLRRYIKADTEIGAALADAVASNATVKAFGAEAREEKRFDGVVQAWTKEANHTWSRFTNAWVLQNMLLWILQAGLLGLVLLEWSNGRATAGDAVFAITSFLLVSGYLRMLGENVQNLQKGIADIEDVVAYALEKEDVVDRADARTFAPGAGHIVFDRVSFGYKNAAEILYSDFSLEIAPGETVALVGPTGSGKTTFVKLVQRLYDVSGGAIRIDGQDVRAVTQASLRRSLALVPQDPALFHRSLRENIAYARPDAAMEEIIACAKRARAHDFISKLPNGYETEVGERGVKLSGGERQRVALARAFLADAPVLILDEATSSLDVETEREVQAAMAELMRGRTTIVIAHRLSTVREADRILVFNQGRVVEQGRHAELIDARGLYARLNAMSRGDVIAEAAA
ncbi:MAG TPA: ABC transporter ATP-binding protein [Vitreimonas sp.]|uniref:ABC transporter ATP-binding protein n=1 Tax=Vitreimonas sp. TaxID=3069702 RepID=UPI002D6E58AF|nr:ABC transporter ATP-binding protein [Vitreimonas sp.]HYD87262.1 ABC transporter ATP-binding protein [Vitreimonas sp.]